jgi:hypothetical protein
MSQAATGPPKEKGAPAKSALQAELPTAYWESPVLQAPHWKGIDPAQ